MMLSMLLMLLVMMLLMMLLKMMLMMMMLILTRTKELMMMHGKLKQSEAKYSAIRDLMTGNMMMRMHIMIEKVTLKDTELCF